MLSKKKKSKKRTSRNRIPHDPDAIRGVVDEALPNALFRVTVESTNEQVLSYLAGKMRMYRIKVLVGDTVALTLDPYGGKARITRRL